MWPLEDKGSHFFNKKWILICCQYIRELLISHNERNVKITTHGNMIWLIKSITQVYVSLSDSLSLYR